MLVLVESGRGVNLETGVFVGKSLRGAVLLVGDSDLKDRKHKILILLILPFGHISDGGSAGQSELLLVFYLHTPLAKLHFYEFWIMPETWISTVCVGKDKLNETFHTDKSLYVPN